MSSVSSSVYSRLGMTLAVLMPGCILLPSAQAQYTEVESNNTKTTANVLNLGTATSATISGTSATNGDPDYFQINTNYQTAGIYVNQLQLNNTTSVIGSLRGLTQTSGTINPGTDAIFQASQTMGTATPYGFNQYYSFGGAGKTQSMYYRVQGAGSATGSSYTSTFTSSRITPTNIGTFSQGQLNFAALANIGSSGVATNTEIFVLDSNFNVYYDNVPSSATFGYIANNDNSGSGVSGFSLARSFSPGTYYIAVGISNVATNDAAAPDDAVRGNSVLDFDNVIAGSNTFYNGNNGNTRPADFSVTDYTGKTFTTSGQQINSLYALNFYQLQVNVAPEPGSFALAGTILFPGAFFVRRRNRCRRRPI